MNSALIKTIKDGLYPLIMIGGETGSGKTLMVHSFLEQMNYYREVNPIDRFIGDDSDNVLIVADSRSNDYEKVQNLPSVKVIYPEDTRNLLHEISFMVKKHKINLIVIDKAFNHHYSVNREFWKSICQWARKESENEKIVSLISTHSYKRDASGVPFEFQFSGLAIKCDENKSAMIIKDMTSKKSFDFLNLKINRINDKYIFP